MALFGNADSSKLAALFPGADLDEVVWTGAVDSFVGADVAFVDVVITTTPTVRDRITADVYKIALTYWPTGPVARGVQNYTHGSSVTFQRVPVKHGGQLALAVGRAWDQSEIAPRVDVVPAGQGESTERERRGQNDAGNPLDKFSESIGLVLGVAALVAVAYILSKAKS